MIQMYDSIDVSQIPADATAVAGYVGGLFVTVPELRARFPRAHLLTIAVTAAMDADCLDIETGDATPAQAAAWYERQKARGVARPCLYASASVMQSDVVPVIIAAKIPRSTVRLWSAHYTGSPHICGPSSCGLMSIDADGCQYTDQALGRNLDASILADDFFGTPPKPAPTGWTAKMIADLPVLSQGDTDKPGGIAYVGRAQVLAKFIGDRNKLPAASAIAATGKFDQATVHGIRVIQGFFGLTQDSVVGPATWGALVAAQRG